METKFLLNSKGELLLVYPLRFDLLSPVRLYKNGIKQRHKTSAKNMIHRENYKAEKNIINPI